MLIFFNKKYEDFMIKSETFDTQNIRNYSSPNSTVLKFYKTKKKKMKM